MKESSTYQAILEEGAALGEVRGIRDVILRQGRKRFGSPTAEQEESLQQIVSVVRLEQLAERILEVESWEELLGVS